MSYSPGMSPEPGVDEGFAERWAAWQARGAAHNRATRRKMCILAAILVGLVAVLNGLWP